MKQKFRLFVQRHDNGSYTVTVPGIHNIPYLEGWDAIVPASQSLAAHGLLLEELKDDLAEALSKWLSRADPASLNDLTNYQEGQKLVKHEIELRPSDRHGKKRSDRLKLKISLLLTTEEGGQVLVSVPKLADPPLAFYCYDLEELAEVATRELAAYLKESPFEELLRYQHQRQEFLEEIEVSFRPLKPQEERKRTEQEESEHFWALRSAALNLSARAKEGVLGRAHRRDSLVDELLKIIASERSASVILVGKPGTGKTALMHEAVRRIQADNCPAELRDRQVWSTSAIQLIAGCCFLGQWEAKLQNVVDEVKNKRHILHLDDPVALMEVGRHSKGDENMAQFLKPYLADGTVVMVGESSPERLRIAETRDPGFTALFRVLHVEEPAEDVTLSILGLVSAALERQFKIRIDPAAQEAALHLTRRFQPYRALPGKAIRFLEQAAADTSSTSGDETPALNRHSAVRAFAMQTGLPEVLLSDHLTLDPEALRRRFSDRLIGQPEAVDSVTDCVTVIKAGLNDPHKPFGCFFFVGRTGVGKTEMAKALAEYLFGSADRMVRFDMSEYAEPMNVGRLIGSAQGDEEGLLTRAVRLQPFSVLFLDEFEKAHPSIFDVMLQVLGEGRLTDAGGRTADFRSAIILMTSNLGASPRERRQPGLRRQNAEAVATAHFKRQVETFFRPEFVNRLDRVVVFHPLDREAMRLIARRELDQLLTREGIARRNLMVEIDPDVIDLLLESGFSPEQGARPLKREIERCISLPLSRFMVGQRIVDTQLLHLSRAGDRVAISASTLSAAQERVTREESPLTDEAGADPRKMDIPALVESLAKQRQRVYEWIAGDTVVEIRNEAARLLATTRENSFASGTPAATEVWERVYHLERISRRVDQLKDRAEYLEEFAQMTRRERSSKYLSDLAQSFTQLRRDLDYLEIELLTSHLTGSSQVILLSQGIGQESSKGPPEPWLYTVAKMHLHWAKRKGYEYSVLLPSETYAGWLEGEGVPPKTHIRGYAPGQIDHPQWAVLQSGDFGALLKRLRSINPRQLVVSVVGPNVFGFLKGEAGTHRLLYRTDPGASTSVQSAAVRVEALEPAEEETALERMEIVAEERRARQVGPPPPVIRTYSLDGDTGVRDLRTGLRTSQVKEVLEGELDEFILAFLRTTEAEEAWSDEEKRRAQ